MALIIKQILNFHDYALEEWRDPRVDEWFLMDSLWKTIGIIAIYLYFVLNLGPKLMENRKPFNLDKILIIYNALQVVYCGVLVVMATIHIIPYYNVLCEPCDYSNSFRGVIAAKLTWWYFLLKVIDLLDTVFFVFRKKSNQITFLHVYHHGIVVLAVWTFARYHPGGSCIYLLYLNSIVHTLMYGYYLLTVLFPLYKYHIWWKKYITQLQLVFFVLKKNYRQITFLHVYHHAGMAGGVWVGARFLGGGNIIYLGYLNCIVHIAMYSYYLLSVFSKSYKNSVWWKRHITHLQLLQFGLLVIMFIILLVSDCAFPKFVSVFLIPQNFFMFYLFGDFYIKTYISPKRKSKISSADKE